MRTEYLNTRDHYHFGVYAAITVIAKFRFPMRRIVAKFRSPAPAIIYYGLKHFPIDNHIIMISWCSTRYLLCLEARQHDVIIRVNNTQNVRTMTARNVIIIRTTAKFIFSFIRRERERV